MPLANLDAIPRDQGFEALEDRGLVEAAEGDSNHTLIH